MFEFKNYNYLKIKMLLKNVKLYDLLKNFK